MPTILPIALGVASSSALLAREHRSRLQAERLAAALLETLLNAIDANDPETGAHVRRVARFALILADAADLDETAQRSVERVALFHDIGKIDEALFDIIHDRAELSPADRRAVAQHPARGVEVLKPLEAFYPDLSEGVLSHHERWDGRGYPRRLAGEEIPLAARIVSIADTFDAVTHERRYHREKSSLSGADVIAGGAGSQFDPTLADLFLCPPVFKCVVHAMRTAPWPRPHRGDERRDEKPLAKRKHVARAGKAPDIAFRWRGANNPEVAQELAAPRRESDTAIDRRG